MYPFPHRQRILSLKTFPAPKTEKRLLHSKIPRFISATSQMSEFTCRDRMHIRTCSISARLRADALG
jgi:hypothetical protein